AAGSKVDESRHYPYGTERSPVDATFPTDYRFTGQLLDSSLGLYHMGARWYDQSVGRWVSPDTIMPDPADPQSLNTYSYAVGNPVRYVDPSGHQQVPPEFVEWAFGVAVGAGSAALAVDLAVGGGAALCTLGLGMGAYCGTVWALQDLGRGYALPEEYDPAQPFGSTYPLPESSTLAIETGAFFVATGAIRSMADHLGFLFGYGAAGMPGFPNPYDRHEPKQGNDPRVNGRHPRNALEGIRKNIGRSDLRTLFADSLTETQYTALTNDLDSLVWDLQNEGYYYEQFGSQLSQEILGLLQELGYLVP
ncbi:MAG TPA: RHS repeat-associated core domain-containing protein, partial [Anaerolineae bacterium]|nr:RHS repeat-associated core domain-containing protein [Anaerolineae bacterium]